MSIAALTTTFVPSPSCLASNNIWKIYTTCPNNNFCYYLLQGPPITSDCLPTAYRVDSTAYYSPAHCPAGYTPACSSFNTVNQITETVHTCCPTAQSFTCLTSKSLGVWPYQSSIGCATQFSGTGTLQVTASSGFSTSPAIETYNGNGGLNAFAVQVRFQSTDFVSTTATGSSSGPTSTPATPAQTVPSTTPTAPPAPSGLSAGAKAGIGVGIAVGALALVAMLVVGYLWGRRRSRQTTTTPGAHEHDHHHHEAMEVERQQQQQPYAESNHQQNGNQYYGGGGIKREVEVSELDGNSYSPREMQ